MPVSRRDMIRQTVPAAAGRAGVAGPPSLASVRAATSRSRRPALEITAIRTVEAIGPAEGA